MQFDNPQRAEIKFELLRRDKVRAVGVSVRPLARDPWILIGWPFPLGFGLGGRLLLARRGRVYV